MQIGELLRKSSELYRDCDAVVFEEQRLTFGGLYERSSRLAAALLAMGLQPGDRVATLGDNQLESLEEICAIALAGLVRSPMYTQNTADIHLYMLNLTGAKALIVQEKYLPEVADRLAEAPSVEHLVVHGAASGVGISYHELLEQSPGVDPRVVVDEDAPHIVRFSAGTTGRPKGIVHSWRGWAAVGNDISLFLPRIVAGDAQLVAGPLSHMSCLLLWPMIAHGATQIVMPKFEARQALALIEREKCGYAILVPTMIQMMVTDPAAAEYDVSSLKCVLYGASPIAERTLREAQALWGNVMYQLYGQSECVPATALLPCHHVLGGTERERRWLRSAGRPVVNSFVRVLDDAGNPCAAGEVGEIVISSNGVMQGIWADPEATAERMIDRRWVRTRDLGYLDEDGFLYIADRKEDMIISGGFNVWPAEVENALYSHPAVLEAAVIGVADERWGETVRAVVVLRDGQTATEQELIDFTRNIVGPVKKPTGVVFREEPLPKSAVGKILRRVVRQEYWRESERQVSGA